MNENVTLIPARKRPGNRIAKAAEKPKLKVAGTAELVLTAMSRLVAMKCRCSITPIT